MRTSHRQIRKRILDAKSKISDEEFFSSRAYNGYLTDLAEAATKRYKRPLRVRVVADHDDDTVAFTDYHGIYINACNHITWSLPTRLLRSMSLEGFNAHECGHNLFTDNRIWNSYFSKLEKGKFYPKMPDGLDSMQKLMTPLFYDGNYNVEKKRMRAVLEREVSNGAVSYRLWRSDGKPDLEYPRAANDAYILHVEVNDHLVPLRMTDYALVNHCGLLPATVALYGSEEGRKEYFKHLRDSGAAGTGSFTEAMARETEKIIELGNDSARQANYIKSVLDQHVAVFLDAKESDGKSFPDFVGALILDEIPSCLALRTKYRAYKQEEALKRQAEQEEQDRAFCEERNRKAEQMIDLAIRTIRGGGTLKNEPISLYKSRYDSSTYSIVNHIMRRYQVDVPLRTQGWINDKLISVTIENGKCEHLRYSVPKVRSALKKSLIVCTS